MADVFNIAGRIHSTSQEEVVTTTNEILDATQEKKQSEVNQEVSEELALHTNRLNALTGQNYVTVVATQSTTPADIPTLINASGEGEQEDTLYRVGFWDGSAYVADKYTEYAWNGTAYVILDVKSSIGEVFDISQYNAVGGTPTAYADLTAALGPSGANVPSSVRRGGMSIKFIQSSDNKYVQARCMTQNFTTDVTQWQGVDVKVTDGSKNLVESGAVALLTNGGILYDNHVDIDLSQLSVFSGSFRNGNLYKAGKSYILPVSMLQYVKLSVTADFAGCWIGYSHDQVVAVSSTTPIADTNLLEIEQVGKGTKMFDIPNEIGGQSINYIYIVYRSSDVSYNVSATNFDSCTKYGGINTVNLSKDGTVYQTKAEARSLVPEDMRFYGVEIIYLTTDGKIDESFIGSTWSVNDEDWENVKDVIKELNDSLMSNNYEYKKTITGSNTRLSDIEALGLSTGNRLYIYPDSVGNIRIYTSSEVYEEVIPGFSYVIPSDIYMIQARGTGSRSIHILINPTNYDEYRNTLKYNKFSIKNLIDQNEVCNVVNLEITDVTSTTNILPNTDIPIIPSGSIVHFDCSDFSSWCNRIRYYFNGSTGATYITQQSTTVKVEQDISLLRLAVTSSDFPEGSTGGTISVRVWWEDAKYQINDLKEKVEAIESQLGGLNPISKQALIDANPSMYDSANDKFTTGTMSHIIGTSLTLDLICSYVAKYTSSNGSYPYIQVYYGQPPFNTASRRLKYELGGKGFFKFGQCKCICPMKRNTNQSAYKTDYYINIVIPEGCELYLSNINSELSNGFINKDSFPVFNHGSAWISNFNTRTNWRAWSHIGNYGAVVVPKRTTDGRWVCYHNDSFGADPDVQVIGDPTAALPAASMQECTFAETQTLEYKEANLFGDHDTIPTLDEFFAQCATMGVHPMLSIHPSWTSSQYEEIKALAVKYNVLGRLNIKGSYNSTLAAIIYSVFGDDIESYLPDKSDATVADVESLASVGFDTSKVKVGFEYLNSSNNPVFFSDEIIAALREHNFVTGLYCSDYHDSHYVKELIDYKLLWEYTSNYFYSNGLSWG